MKKLNLIIMTLVAVMALAACNDGVTYADLKKKGERPASVPAGDAAMGGRVPA